MFSSDNVLFWLVIGEESKDSIPDRIMAQQKAVRGTGRLQTEQRDPAASIPSNHPPKQTCPW